MDNSWWALLWSECPWSQKILNEDTLTGMLKYYPAMHRAALGVPSRAVSMSQDTDIESVTTTWLISVFNLLSRFRTVNKHLSGTPWSRLSHMYVYHTCTHVLTRVEFLLVEPSKFTASYLWGYWLYCLSCHGSHPLCVPLCTLPQQVHFWSLLREVMKLNGASLSEVTVICFCLSQWSFHFTQSLVLQMNLNFIYLVICFIFSVIL